MCLSIPGAQARVEYELTQVRKDSTMLTNAIDGYTRTSVLR